MREGTLWLHVKTSHLYVVVGRCRLERENAPAILYRLVGGNGPVWARAEEEFMDGRFAYVDSTQVEPRITGLAAPTQEPPDADS